MATQSVNLHSENKAPLRDPSDPEIRKEFFEEGWEIVKLSSGVTNRLCRAERALTGLSGVLELLEEDHNSRHYALDEDIEEFKGLYPDMRFRLRAVVRTLSELAREQLEEIRETPGCWDCAPHPRARGTE